jgi:hypothetical protein
MKVKCIDKLTPRTDNVPGKPTGITLGKVYVVAEECYDGKYSIINDNNKLARYSMNRFEIVCDEPVRSLRDAFNTLTTPLRTRIKELERQLEDLK